MSHQLCERHVIKLVERGELAIDCAGRVWRMAARRGLKNGGSHLVPCEPRRAEHETTLGYLQVRAVVDGRRYYALAHRLIWQHFHGDIADGLTVNHRDGVKSHNAPENLELATYSEQALHAAALGLVSWERDELGRFAAGRLLDGRTWDEMPTAARELAELGGKERDGDG